jgi:hypothetical protein
MMQRKKRLRLAKETLRELQSADLTRVGGARVSDCPGLICGPTETCQSNCNQVTCGCYAIVNWGNLYYFKG